MTRNANTPTAAHPRLGAISFLHRFGSALNRHTHLHAAVTDGVFLPGPHGPDGPPAFLPARPLTQGDLAALTELVRRRVIGWFKRQGFGQADAQSRYVLHLLPALPTAWPDGKVTGLRARGGFVVDLEWAQGKLTSATVQSLAGKPCRIRHGGKTQPVKIPKGASWRSE